MNRSDLAAVALLDDDVRRALYAFARTADEPITRDSAASAVGISRKLAAFHLDKLVEAGLLSACIRPVAPRRVGRSPKVYAPTDRAVTVHIPDREPELLASILVEAAARSGGPGARRVENAARARGKAIGAAERERSRPGRLGAERSRRLVVDLLGQHGFEPSIDDQCVVLRNCPFHPLAAQAPELVCGLNRQFIRGLTEGLQADAHLETVLRPQQGRCCVELQPRR